MRFALSFLTLALSAVTFASAQSCTAGGKPGTCKYTSSCLGLSSSTLLVTAQAQRTTSAVFQLAALSAMRQSTATCRSASPAAPELELCRRPWSGPVQHQIVTRRWVFFHMRLPV
ncbi:hypothetical protein B0H13DRAFT_2274008 [Mycena leptocephala]|nr:hypothetical protein B0H13DRAFT_2274008 [Mycena leptocephala]